MRKLSLFAIAIAALGFFTAIGAEPAAPAGVGKAAPQFTLQDQSGNAVSLADYKGKIVVLEWVHPGCPFVVRHYDAGTMTSLASKYKDKDVVWLAINSTAGTTNDANKKFADERKLAYPVLNDSAGATGKAYGATNTPHMYIIDAAGNLAYRGAIDDDPGGKKADRTNYVDKALGELLAGQTVTVSETKAYGCSVKYAK